VNPLGLVLVVAGCGIALGALVCLAVVALITVRPWSRTAPRYHRGAQPGARRTATIEEVGRAVLAFGLGVRPTLADRRQAVTRHPHGARHLLSLLHGR
jgi:hypothetical protein